MYIVLSAGDGWIKTGLFGDRLEAGVLHSGLGEDFKSSVEKFLRSVIGWSFVVSQPHLIFSNNLPDQ